MGMPSLGPVVLGQSMPWKEGAAADSPILHLLIHQGFRVSHAGGKLARCTGATVPALRLSTSSPSGLRLIVLELTNLRVSVDAHPDDPHWTTVPGDVYMGVAEQTSKIKVSIEKLNAGKCFVSDGLHKFSSKPSFSPQKSKQAWSQHYFVE